MTPWHQKIESGPGRVTANAQIPKLSRCFGTNRRITHPKGNAVANCRWFLLHNTKMGDTGTGHRVPQQTHCCKRVHGRCQAKEPC